MKKTMIFAAIAALVSLASCQKDEIMDNGTGKSISPVFTASISGATRTTIDMTDGKVEWEATDEITVTDATSASAIYEIESIDATTGKATFVYKSGTTLGAGPYTATYGTEPATAQTYSATAGKLYMTAPATSSNSFEFTVQCGLMKLNLTKTGESVKSIAVTGTPTGGSETTYTLTCTEAQSIATAKDFYIALPAGSYTKIKIKNASVAFATLNSASGLNIAANYIKPVTFDASKLNFIPTRGKAYATTPDCDVNWVQLWENGPKFAEFNLGAANNKPEDYGEYYSGNSGRAVKDNAPEIWGENWRTPTNEEYAALLTNCVCNKTTVEGVKGYTFTGKGDYSCNSIFFPAAGKYYNKAYLDVGVNCYYWTSILSNSSEVYSFKITIDYPYVESQGYTSTKLTVRAVLAE